MAITNNEPPAIGIIGGSGLYQMEELRDATEHKIDTPFGLPSDTLVGGKISGRQVYFLPRHGRGHRILPHELNHRANIYALRSLNVRWVISVTAVGSFHARGIGTESPVRFRRDRDDKCCGSETGSRSGNRTRHHGHDHRLRLLED